MGNQADTAGSDDEFVLVELAGSQVLSRQRFYNLVSKAGKKLDFLYKRTCTSVLILTFL